VGYRICRECGEGPLEITGTGYYEDTIIVECPHCGEEYELEPDGLGEGGFEMVEAMQAEMRKREQSECPEL
jgi:hypothetical protein